MRQLCLALLLAAVWGCGDDDDVTVYDATPATVDAAADLDASVAPIDAGHDAAVSADAMPVADAVARADADVTPDAAGACGLIGKPCTPVDGCGAGLVCEFSVDGDFCTKMRPGCGGIAGATCDDPSAPLCHYVAGSTAGVCLSAFERDCICTRSPGSIVGCP